MIEPTTQTMHDIWQELGQRVRQFVARRVADGHTADDITQDVMLKVQSRLDQRPENEKLPAWVFAIARNAIIDHYRASALRDHADITAAAELASGDDDAERQQAISELQPCLARMIDQLPEPYRQAMKLADLEGVPQQQIADGAGISLSAAKSRVQRARQMLREMVLDCCKVEQDARGNVVDYHTTPNTGRYCNPDGQPCGS